MTRTLSTIPTGRRGVDLPPAARLARVRRSAAELTPAAIEQIAQRVAELLAGGTVPAGAPAGLVDAGTVARHFGLTRGWVYEHAGELGAIRLGDGPKARLRFDLAAVEAALEHGHSQGVEVKASPRPPTPRRHPREPRRPAGADASLLPISTRTRVRGIVSRWSATRRRGN
jgi:hypothetical protein